MPFYDCFYFDSTPILLGEKIKRYKIWDCYVLLQDYFAFGNWIKFKTSRVINPIITPEKHPKLWILFEEGELLC